MSDPTESTEDSTAEIADQALVPTVYDKLKAIRVRTDLKFTPPSRLKETFIGLDGKERPISLRYYQVQGVMHLLVMTRFLLGDDTGLGKCKTQRSLVLTDQGPQTIGSLAAWRDMEPDTFAPTNVPLKVWTGWEWAPVKQFYYGGTKPIRRMRTRRGYETDGSLVHPLWTRQPDGIGDRGKEGFVQTRHLQEGDYLVLDRRPVDFPESEPSLRAYHPVPVGDNAKPYTLPEWLTPDLAAFLAYVVAEGYTVSPYHTTVTQHRDKNPETHDHIRALASSLFGWDGNEEAVNRDTTIGISSVRIRAYLQGLGVGDVLSAFKTVPWPIFQGTRASVASFLRAFFDAEGSVGSGVVEVSSASEQLLREVQVLLLRFGIVCTRARKMVKGRDHTYWRLTLCGDDLRAFKEHIGFLTPRKQEALVEAAAKSSNPNLDVIPYARDLVADLRQDLLLWTSVRGSNGARKGTGLKQFGVSFEKTLNNIRHGWRTKGQNRNPTYAFLREMLEVARKVGADKGPAYKAMETVVDNHFFYDPIESIVSTTEPVMDLEVDHPRHSFVADGFVNHNTLQSVTALCFLWDRNPDLKAIVLTSKSAVEQWAGEFEKFTYGVKAFVCRGSPAQRAKIRYKFQNTSGPTVLVMGYSSAKQDFSELQDWEGFVLITDEATAYKNHATQTHQVCKYLSSKASRTWALTATLIKNNLVEGWGIYNVVVPGLFGTHNAFLMDYCITRMMQVPGSRRQVPMIVGYRPKDVAAFRQMIDPYFLGRPKFEVASELPPLITRHVKVDMSAFQQEKYDEALQGLLNVGITEAPPPDKEANVTVDANGKMQEEKEVTKLTAVTYCQQIVNHPGLIGFPDEGSAKLEALLDLVGDGEFAGEKVIVFTRFRKMVDIIMPALKKAGVKAVRITGSEDEKGRKASQDAFQKPDGDTRVVVITTAAAEAINLQAAKLIVFYDTPWSAGDYIQLLGRMIRIGSIHDRCYALHIVARGTIDDRVATVLAKKMGLVEAVLGKRIKGEDTDTVVETQNDLSDLFDILQSDARARQKGSQA